MTQERALAAAFALVGGVLVLAATTSAAGQQSIPELIAVARTQVENTQATLYFANNLMIPRFAGIGIGLAAGLAVGSVVAFVTWGET